MKKILFLVLLIASVSYGQAIAPTRVKITNNVISTSAPFINAQETDGFVNKINKADLVDVLEFSSATTLPTTGVAGKIYVTIDNNRIYRWNGTVYIEYFLSKEDKANKGVANGYASLDSGGKVPLSQINDALLGAVNYKGNYNASTNTPTLGEASSSNKGYYYTVSVAGTQFGKNYVNGDWIVSNGVIWDKVDNNNAVTSVNGFVGSVMLTTANVAETANKRYQTDAQQTNNDATSPIQAQINAKIGGSGTSRSIPVFTALGTIGSSVIQDNTNLGNGVEINFGATNNILNINTSNVGGVQIRAAQTGLQDMGAGDGISIVSLTGGFQKGTDSYGGFKVLTDVNFINSKLGFYTGAYTGNPILRATIKNNGDFLVGLDISNGQGIIQANGNITASPATLSNQVVVKSQLDAITNNTALTGIPTAPTALAGTNTTQLATTAFVLANTAKTITVRKISTAITLADSDNGTVILLTASCTVTLPNGLMSGFNISFATKSGAVLTYTLGNSVLFINNAGTTMGELSSHTVVNTGTANEYLTVGL
ncbi:hypothetical protein ACNQF7_10170 [Flavobacterium sp. RSP29]|uniref:hypothetical protein n=1 Tax=Flavobacterium sp. RSP29 TaxID=3401731 RepID=UPI003AAAAA0A